VNSVGNQIKVVLPLSISLTCKRQFNNLHGLKLLINAIQCSLLTLPQLIPRIPMVLRPRHVVHFLDSEENSLNRQHFIILHEALVIIGLVGKASLTEAVNKRWHEIFQKGPSTPLPHDTIEQVYLSTLFR
jgi:hypothetical protein